MDKLLYNITGTTIEHITRGGCPSLWYTTRMILIHSRIVGQWLTFNIGHTNKTAENYTAWRKNLEIITVKLSWIK